MVFPDKDHIDFFSFFHRKGLEIVWNNFNENFLFLFFFFNNIDKSEPEVNFHWKLCYTHAN